MREYTAHVTKSLVDLCHNRYQDYLVADIKSYGKSQELGREIKQRNEWGLIYPSVRTENAKCLAIFRPPALTIPVQAGHYDYIWDGNAIIEVRKLIRY